MPQATCHTCLINVVKRGAFIWPVAITLLDTVLSKRAQHDNDSAAMFPHHLWARQRGFHYWDTAQVGGQSSPCDPFCGQNTKGPQWAGTAA